MLDVEHLEAQGQADDGRIEVEFEVDQNVVGQTWQVVITDNGTRVVKTTATTTAPSGSFDVERRTANLAGTDRFVAKATNPATGETCRGVVASDRAAAPPAPPLQQHLSRRVRGDPAPGGRGVVHTSS